MPDALLKLVEESSGAGELLENGVVLRQVRYHIQRYQGMLPGSGLPIPGLHRIEGAVDLQLEHADVRLVGAPLTLRLEDGRAIGITLAARDGRILTVGHGPGCCSCC